MGEATRDALGRSRSEPAGRITPSMGQTAGERRTVLSIMVRDQEGGKQGGNNEKIVDAEEG
jgi:hypothetical protein